MKHSLCLLPSATYQILTAVSQHNARTTISVQYSITQEEQNHHDAAASQSECSNGRS